jgi:asparagine synthase (glutamine-hydrolysing)
MAAVLNHRGPDDAGVWSDENSGVTLAHKRLSILDLSEAGHQPMKSHCGRYVLVFNGEIYNHKSLRVELENAGYTSSWRGYSDTETLVNAISVWGIEGALKKLNGMFAFAVWDKKQQQLILARDRLGEKPLFYGKNRGTFLFGSELKALKMHPDWEGTIDRGALCLYLRHNYVPSPWSIYQGIRKLPPAHYIIVSNQNSDVSEPIAYWGLEAPNENSLYQNKLSTTDIIDELDSLIKSSISMRMEADVPLGTFLSGGVDSTMVAAQMQSMSQTAIKTFTIGFEEAAFNEAGFANNIAQYLGTDHHELYVTSHQAISVIPLLPTIYDEPFADSSQIPTFLISQLAKQYVTVALSGDGGDELFYGYSRYQLSNRIWCILRLMPLPLRKLAIESLQFGGRRLSALSHAFSSISLDKLSDRLPKIAALLEHGSAEYFYESMVSHWKTPSSIVIGGHEPESLFDVYARENFNGNFKQRMTQLDLLSYLPDDILTKVDRASMSVSLEARVPLLDHRLVEYAWQLPMNLKYKNGEGKWVLKKLLDRYVPNTLMKRPKMGFGVPIEEWLKGPLRGWAEQLLERARIEQEGYFHADPIIKMWEEHKSGKRRWHYYLWDILMFQAWLENQS